MTIIFTTKNIKKGKNDKIEDNLLLFTLLGHNYALFSSSIIQILQTITITPVANTVPYFMGSTTFRGDVVPVIDLQSFFYGGQLNLTTKRSKVQSNYIAVEYVGKFVIFRVETVIGSINKPEESQMTNLVNFANPEENPYFVKAFLSFNNQIIVLIDNAQILERIIYELDQSQSEFISENQLLLVPMELPEVFEELSIDLRQKLSVPVPSTTDRGFQKTVKRTKKTRNTATLVSIENLDILIPNNRIVEIFNTQSVTEVPNASKTVVGTTNFRGKVISVLDLAEILIPTSFDKSRQKTRYQQGTQTIILEIEDQQVAIIVEEFREIVELIESDIRLAVGPTSDRIFSYYFQGVMLDRSGHIILVLNVDFLFNAISDLETLDEKITKSIFFVTPTDDLRKRTIRQETLNENTLVLITLLENIFALESSSVFEILQNLIITPIANSTPYFVGSTTFRGEVTPVIDLETFLYHEHGINVEISPKDYNSSYIALEYIRKIIIFQVSSILGFIGRPDESQITRLIKIENISFYPSAFLYNDQIVILLDHNEILNRIAYELEQVQTQFIEENQALLVPMKLPETLEDLNIHLHQNISIARSVIDINPNKVIDTTQDHRDKGTLVSVRNLNILVKNNYISEIFHISKITKVPNSPKAIIGTINYRGNVIPVLNLAEILLPNSVPSSLAFNNEAIILEVQNQYIALITDKIQSIHVIEKSGLRPIIESADGKISQHFLQGVLITQSEQIILILNVEYLLQIAENPILLEQESSQLLYFKNPIQSFIRTHDVKREGLLFENNGYIFFLDSKNVIQVIEEDSFLFKNFPHSAIKGAAIHTNIVPLIDFTTLLREKKDFNLDKSVGILINDPKSNTEVVLLVDSIIDRIEVKECDVFQNYLGISRKTLSPIISGFFSYQGKLGMILNPESFHFEIKEIIQNSLSLMDMKKEFMTTLLPEEIKFLEDVKAKRKELELLLFYQHEGIRLDLFVFKLQKYALSIDVTLIRRVFSSLKWQRLEDKHHPVIGTAMVNDVEVPVIDLAALIFNSHNQTEFQQYSFHFLLDIENQLFLVPTNDIEGVVTKFEEELIHCEESIIFLEGKETCQNIFSHENISSSIYIIESEFLKRILSTKKLETLLKKKKNEMKKKD
ncbi:MAG: chemotaxis protein CheW [Candidatus Thorarchaeota archaeon]